jgi:hypothetical protein
VTRSTRAIAAAAAALLLLIAPASEAAKRKVPRGFFGVNYAGQIENAPTQLQAEQWDRLDRAGVESARILFNWEIANYVRSDPIDWRFMDSDVRFASEHRIEVLPVVMYAPPWAKRYRGWDGSPPKRVSDYTAFLKKAIRRYGPHGVFWREHPDIPKRPLRRWQIWNEVDLQFQWYRREDTWQPKHAAAYGKLLRAAYRTVHKADPGAKVLSASLAIDSWIVLEKLYRNGGIRGYFDIAGVQVEAGDWRFLPTVLRRFRAVLDRHGAGRVPMWGTEFGWPASDGRTPTPSYTFGYMTGYTTDDDGMASRLTNGYNLLAKRSLRRELRLERLMWFTAVSPYSGSFEYDYSGLLWHHGDIVEPKPAYEAYAQTARRHEGRR